MSSLDSAVVSRGHPSILNFERDAARRIAQLQLDARFDVASRVAHGIRTPLASILGFTEILRDATTISEADRAEFHRIISAESGRLTRFVATLRDFMDLHDGVLRLDKTLSDLGQTVRSAVEACAEDAQSHGVRLLNAVSQDAVVIAADHTRLGTAMEQVIANAIQATSARGRVVVQLYRTSRAAMISVADTGVGIPSKDVARVTDAFYRIDRRDGSESRLGLGLTLARAVAEMHDGSLTVASREGVGSIIVIRLPQEPALGDESNAAA